MQIEELVNGINLESDKVEFKGIIEDGRLSDGSYSEISWLKTLAAFANTDGGDMYIGVEDKSHKVLALDHKTTDRVIRMIHHQIREKIEPKINYNIDTIPVPDTSPIRYVVHISVSHNENLPVTVHSKGMIGIYVRNYGQTEIASSEQIRDLVLMSENIPYDQPFTQRDFKKEDFSKLFGYFSKIGVAATEKALMSIGFISSDRKLSKGAELFADDCDKSETRIVLSLWPDFNKGSDVVLAHKELTGNLIEEIQEAIDFVNDHSANGFIKTNTSREIYKSYPDRSVMEGIVNAIGHRNYFIQGAQIEVNIFRDRLEITSPGSLLGVRKLDHETDIASIIPRRRNEVICAMLEMCRYMEEKGSGFDKIEDDYSMADESHKPFVSSDASSFTLTLPDLTYAGGIEPEDSETADVTVNEVISGKNDLKILGFCYYKERSVEEIAEYIGISPSSYFRRNTIKRLTDGNYLIKKSAERGYRYVANHSKVFRR